MGAVRLILKDANIDVVPRMGRMLLFKSEVVEHQMRPTVGYDNYVLTVWFKQLVKKERYYGPPRGENSGTIFVGIQSYRDEQLQYTLRSLFYNAKHPENLRVSIYHSYERRNRYDSE